MKNSIPLILAVLLGLAAVLAVGRLLASRKTPEVKTVGVVAASRDITRGQAISEDSIMKKDVPVSAVPAQAVYWTRSETVVGQKAQRAIAQNDYILFPDIGLSRTMSSAVGEGEWAVSLALPESGVGRVVQPGDEVAIIGTFKVETDVKSADLSAPNQKTSKEATLVLFPRVRVLDVGGKSLGSEGRGSGVAEIIVALPPQQAQLLVASQRKAQLTIALRRLNDNAMLNRIDAGMIDEASFDDLLKDLKPVQLPKIPGTVGASN